MTEPYYQDATTTVLHGDCLDVLPTLADASVDAVCTDPPYGLEFMGKEWDAPWKHGFAETGYTDGKRMARPNFGSTRNPVCLSCHKHQRGTDRCLCEKPAFDERPADSNVAFGQWCELWAAECLRVLKPGGHLLAFGGTRTSHRLACAIEDAGFEIRDSIGYMHNRPLDGQAAVDVLKAWQAWTRRVPHAGVRFADVTDDSVPAPVLLSTSLGNSLSDALIAELSSSEALLTDGARWRSVLSDAAATTTASSSLVNIAESLSASHGPTSTSTSTAPGDAPDWLSANIAAKIKGAAALRIWRGSKPSTRQAATDALCAALTDDLRLITCAQSKTFQSYDMTCQTVCASAMTVTTTASTAALLISSMAATLASLLGGDATEADSSGPLAWVYGSGFPPAKSLDVSKAIDKAAGAGREVVGQHTRTFRAEGSGIDGWQRPAHSVMGAITAPATDDARTWQGWGTALKPAFEPVIVARKPLQGSVAANVLRWGTGALNVDGCRIEGEHVHTTRTTALGVMNDDGWKPKPATFDSHPAGRWPPNVAFDEEMATELDRQSGTFAGVAGGMRQVEGPVTFTVGEPIPPKRFTRGQPDFGGASRFMYVAKADGAERPFYYRQSCDCEDSWPTTSHARAITEATRRAASSTSRSGSDITDDLFQTATRSTTSTETSSTTIPPTFSPSPLPSTSASTQAVSSATENGGSPALSAVSSSRSVPITGTSAARDGRSTAAVARATSSAWGSISVCGECGAKARRESHATVKPLALMRWLVRLVTPPGGVILEPFAGSGATVEAARLEGFRIIAIEREADYLPLIDERIRRSDVLDFGSIA